MTGTTAVASGGTFTSSVAVAVDYLWEYCDASGGSCAYYDTANTLDVTPVLLGRRLRVTARGTSSGGSATISSAIGPVIVGAPAFLSVPTLSGVAHSGSSLGVNLSMQGTAPISSEVEWHRCDAAGAACQATPERTGSSALLGAIDIGSTIRIHVTLTNAHGSQDAWSSPVLVTGDPPAFVAVGSIQGDAVVGQALRAGGWVWRDAAWTTVQWQRCSSAASIDCTDIPGASSIDYVTTVVDRGSYLLAVQTAGNGAGSRSGRTTTMGPIRIDSASIPTIKARLATIAPTGRATATWEAPDGALVEARIDRTRIGELPRTRQPAIAYRGSSDSFVVRVGADETACLTLLVVQDNVAGASSPEQCVSGVIAASKLRARGVWRTQGEVRIATKHGATLSAVSRASVVGATVRLRTCASCGRVVILWKSRVVRVINLRGRAGLRSYVIPNLTSPGPGTFAVMVTGNRRPVQVSGIALHLDP